MIVCPCLVTGASVDESNAPFPAQKGPTPLYGRMRVVDHVETPQVYIIPVGVIPAYLSSLPSLSPELLSPFTTMPTGTPYDSFVRPYQIRVDNFTGTTGTNRVPYLYLLSHTHTDHVAGLAARSFSGRIICSPDAKQMLLRHEVYAERTLKDMDIRAEKVRTFKHLKIDPMAFQDGSLDHTKARDLIVRSSGLIEKRLWRIVKHCLVLFDYNSLD